MERRSWRPPDFAKRHSVSLSFVYNEIREGRLRAHKPAGSVTIITSEDEADWLANMPTIGMPKPAESINGRENSSNSEAAAE